MVESGPDRNSILVECYGIAAAELLGPLMIGAHSQTEAWVVQKAANNRGPIAVKAKIVRSER